MLVLGRKVGERILVGEDVVVTVVSVGRDGVRVGIDAPREVRVHRAEIVDQVAADNRAAALGAPGGEARARALLGLDARS
ncbi:carbon storage regulator, CsrA [Cellulosimicrobium aquatile]|uniref:Translational regulator CsrA n=2 Tax=Cellulosimicrobium TaxID=157920 RepID=A0A4Y8R120_9MICO|nr:MULTISPECIES: carbon storage regulator CsrA [Cellulosimicrobium]TGA71178.1 carbon storage regulator [Cellulosimicrobium terreum]MCM3536273.1 carbon storage regulator CsrA [Cellulosimicrobium funkei]MDQ8042585.1 carbon storage regulator CsrA [Cellulosimicrobium sp. XJ-DQ-B-000]NMF30196.1 carbon storage regulator CsrA [Cellulosimicrobium aquatile]TFF07798.1 carbon storage regulator [Cellulosimicrobium funkei]